jgi:hypothetical protein
MPQAMCERKETHAAPGNYKEVAVPYRPCRFHTEGVQRVHAFKYTSV